MRTVVPVISCEHASNSVPKAFQYLFDGAAQDLNSHLGWDPGALFWAKAVAGSLGLDLFSYDFTRLLIEVNRSEHSPQLFSKYSSELSDSIKKYLLETYYRPYRRNVRRAVEHQLEWDRDVVHLSVHSFTPVFHGETREVEIGLLFDDERPLETQFCVLWKQHLEATNPRLTVRMNEPYLGKDDGLCTRLRNRFGVENYLGIELEVNQKFVDSDKEEIARILVESFKQTLNDYKSSRSARIAG